MKTEDWTPEIGEREYYRNDNGDLGYRVVRDGRDMIQFDRPNQVILRHLDRRWHPEEEHRPHSRDQIARIAFEADRHLCLHIGMPHRFYRKEWNSLKDEEKDWWRHRGPQKHPERKTLYDAIMTAMEQYTE